MIVIATLMNRRGATGVQTHINEFCAYLQSKGLRYEVANPFLNVLLPLLISFVLLRRVLELVLPPAAVLVYRFGHSLLLSLRLRWIMFFNDTCVIYAQCPISAGVALKVRRYPLRQKVVLVVHFNTSQADEWIGKGMITRGGVIDKRIRREEGLSIIGVDAIVYVSEFMRTQLQSAWPMVCEVPSCVVPNFIASIGDVIPSGRVDGRDLINIGTLEPRKNQAFLLHVLSEANRRGRRLTLTLVGDGPDKQMLMKLASEMGLQDQVYFEGQVGCARTLIPGHKLYVHSARMESQGIVLIEALSCGVPVIAAPVGGIPEVFDDQCEGFFWPLESPGAACEILISALSDDELLKEMGSRGRIRFASEFCSEIVASRLHQYLVSTIGS